METVLDIMYVSFGSNILAQRDLKNFINLNTLKISYTDLKFIALDAFDNLPLLKSVILQGNNNLDAGNIRALRARYKGVINFTVN